MFTLGTVQKTVITLEESYLLAISAITTEIMPHGTPVVLNNDATVSAVTAVTDVPYGILTVGATKVGDRVTVNTPFNAIVRGKADGALVVGTHVACSGLDTGTEKLSKYKTAVATNMVIGVVLSAASDGEDVSIGILRTGHKMA